MMTEESNLATISSEVRLGEQARRNTRARFEQWAQNPACQANTVSAVHNIKMSDVARAEGVAPSFGQSPFAVARGQVFERELLWNNAERLITVLIERDVIPSNAVGLADLRIAMNGGPLASLEVAIQKTKDLLPEIITTPEATPAVIAGATLRIPKGVMLPEAILIIDAMAVRTDRDLPELIVGEVKTYPDRGGHTDSHDLALARAQAGLYVHALQLLIAELGITDHVRVRTDGFLVLTRPGSNRPSIRAGEDFRFQAERARRGFELLERAALGLPPFSPVGDEPITAIVNSDTEYSEACLSFCDRAPKCHEEALEAGNPAVLGDDVARFLGGVDLHRTMALLDGNPAQSEAESDLLRRIAETDLMASR
jgi:hypothetical protein